MTRFWWWGYCIVQFVICCGVFFAIMRLAEHGLNRVDLLGLAVAVAALVASSKLEFMHYDREREKRYGR